MNNINLIGRLVKDVELKYTSEGKAVANFVIAVNRQYQKNEADFFPIVIWGKPAENCATYISKGSKVAVTGRVQIRSYDASDGNKRYITEVIANNVEFLDSKQDATNSEKVKMSDFQQIADEDVPF